MFLYKRKVKPFIENETNSIFIYPEQSVYCRVFVAKARLSPKEKEN